MGRSRKKGTREQILGSRWNAWMTLVDSRMLRVLVFLSMTIDHPSGQTTAPRFPPGFSAGPSFSLTHGYFWLFRSVMVAFWLPLRLLVDL